jgi:DNA repair protein RecO (recombination protein O)
MPLVKTQGIVLRSIKFGDTSRIATFYTRDSGRISVMAKGARVMKSPFGAGLNLFVRSELVFSYKEGRDLQTLTRCELMGEHRGFERDPLRLAHAGVVAELVDRVAVGEEPFGELFELLRATLGRLDTAPADRLSVALWLFELRLADLLGYLPRLDACASCGGPLGESRVLGIAEGGLLCRACGTGRDRTMELGSGSVEILRLLVRGGWEPASRVKPLRAQAIEIEDALVAYLHEHALGNRALRSLRVLRELRRLRMAA